VLGAAGSVQAWPPAADYAGEAALQQRVLETYGRLPLYFIENQGQLDERVAYYVQGRDKTLYFTRQGLTMALTGPAEGGIPQRYVVKLEFVGANPGVWPVGKDRTEAIISYFKGPPEEWHVGLPSYRSVVYADLWPGIDLVYSGDVNRLKYTFLVRPGADPERIQLTYRGATGVRLNEAGQLEVRYSLNEETHTYGFRVGAYDPTRPLVLDPAVLIYCGYIGGFYFDPGYDIAVDGDGNAYVAGATMAVDFPVTVGPDLTYNGGDRDAFVARVRADGTGLDYCGYIGGSGDDYGVGIAVDGEGNAYVTGWTDSTETSFPVVEGPDLTYNGGDADAFVTKVNPGGTGLVYSGYIGGSDGDYGYEIVVDGSGNAYLTGYTRSSEAEGFPVTVGPDLTYNGYMDAFVAKVSAAGTGLDYCGYIGGSSDDSGLDIAVDGEGNAYVTGWTSSTEASFPVVEGPDLTYNGGDRDASVAMV